MKKKRWFALGLTLVIGLSLFACGKGNTLLEGAAVGNSALSMYYYDGKDTVCGHLFDKAEVQMVVDSLASVDVVPEPDWSPADLSAPMFGIYIMKEDGRPLSAVWSASLWITQEGEAYRFPYSVAKIWGDHEWQAMNTWSGEMVLPAQHALAYRENAEKASQDGGGDSYWDPTWMTPAGDMTAADGHEIELVEWSDTAVTVTLINHSDEDWTFGEYYHLEVNLNGTWYHVPTAPGENWAVHDLAYVLPAGGEMEMTYSLICYGVLPAGHYRLVAEAFEEGLAVETHR